MMRLTGENRRLENAEAVGYIVGRVFDLLKSLLEDDIFKAATASLNIASLTARWADGRADSPEAVAMFEGHGGRYEVTCDWRVLRVSDH
jgi:hypothetical protein